jgi:hypothetical protein
MTILFEVYFELLFTGLISMYTPEGNSNYTFLTFLAGGIILFIVTVIVPLTLIYVLSRPQDKLDDIEFK